MNTMHRLTVMAVVAVGVAATAVDASAQGPMFPIYESNWFDGVNPSGGMDTRGVTTFNSVNDFGRNMSRFNGSRRMVNEPIFQNGQLVGWRQGEAWDNSFTGRGHFSGRVITNNRWGGTNVQGVRHSQLEVIDNGR